MFFLVSCQFFACDSSIHNSLCSDSTESGAIDQLWLDDRQVGRDRRPVCWTPGSQYAGLKLRRWREIDFPAKEFAIRFCFVTFMLSYAHLSYREAFLWRHAVVPLRAFSILAFSVTYTWVATSPEISKAITYLRR